MDQFNQQNIQTQGQFSQFNFSKKSIQILLSISVFSILLSCSPLLPLLSHCVSIFSFLHSVFSCTPDRKCIFLFCNGILVFLIKNSGLAGTSPPGTDTNHEHEKQIVDHSQQSVPESAEKRAVAREEVAEAEEQKGIENENLVAGGGNENELLIAQEESEEDGFLIIEEGEEDGMGLLSAEELNKKCDDFIRKVKEGIKYEAQKLIIL